MKKEQFPHSKVFWRCFVDTASWAGVYTDRGSHYFHTPKAGGKVDKDNHTQVGRALKQLGIDHIAAYSLQARGRSERPFRTFQDRLVKELALDGIKDIKAANRYLKEVFIPDYNHRFAAAPKEDLDAFVCVAGQTVLRDILCVQSERVVQNDNCVQYNSLKLRLPPDQSRHHYARARVRVHEYPDRTLAVFHGPRKLAC